MKKTKLGHFDVELSELCFETDQFGSRIDAKSAFELLDLFRNAGATFLDTATFYSEWMEGCSGGKSETTIGLTVIGYSNLLQGVYTRDDRGLPSRYASPKVAKVMEKQP